MDCNNQVKYTERQKKSNYRRNRKASMSMKAFPDAQKTASC